MAIVFTSILVAIPAFHGHSLAVQHGLQTSRLQGSTKEFSELFTRFNSDVTAVCDSCGGEFHGRPAENARSTCVPLNGNRTGNWFHVLRFWICSFDVLEECPYPASRLHCVLAVAFRFEDSRLACEGDSQGYMRLG